MIWWRGRDTRSQLMSNSCKKCVKRTTYFLWVVYRFRIGVNKAVYWLFITFLKSKFQGLESPWKLQSVLESPGISVLTLSNPDSQVPNMKDLQDKIAHVVVQLKKTKSLFCTEWSPWKMRNVSLKVLEVFVQKRVRTVLRWYHLYLSTFL